jgi:hypothetical protein
MGFAVFCHEGTRAQSFLVKQCKKAIKINLSQSRKSAKFYNLFSLCPCVLVAKGKDKATKFF